MTYWFHRNPIKPTQFVKFDLKGVATNDSAGRICSELRQRRDQLYHKLANAANDATELETDFLAYVRLLHGLIYEIGATESSDDGSASKKSKLYPLVQFRWAHSMLGGVATEVNDPLFELCCMSMNVAFWLAKHAAVISGKDEVFEKDAKEVLTRLRKAAGILNFVKEKCGALSGAAEEQGGDFDLAVLDAYAGQFIAEAQEVVVVRSIELKHEPKLISALASNTADKFHEADQKLVAQPEEVFGKWRRYLQLKSHFYRAYAYAFLGELLLKEDKCGDAIRACREGLAEYATSEAFATKYAETNGPGFRATPQRHPFFLSIRPLLQRHLEKAERENGMIYHQKIADDCPKLEAKPEHGIVTPIPFQMPDRAEAWTPAIYGSFDVSKADTADFKKAQRAKEKLEPVKEEKCYQTDRAPKTASGCSIS